MLKDNISFLAVLLNLLPERVALGVCLINDVVAAVPKAAMYLIRLVNLGDQVQYRLQLIREPLITQVNAGKECEESGSGLTVTIGLPPVAVGCDVFLRMYSRVKHQ